MIDDEDALPVMSADEAAKILAGLPLMESVPPGEIEWLLRRGELRRHAQGDVLRLHGAPIDEMSIPVTGRLGLYVPRSGGLHRAIDAGPGYVVGVTPYSRIRTAPGNLVAETDGTVLNLHRSNLPDLIRDCPNATAALVHQLIDRVRDFRTVEMHNERLLALGKLASGLAHELNNPASGASSSARLLPSLLQETQRASRALAAAGLSESQLRAVDAVCDECARTGPERNALELADREDDFIAWLERHGIEPTAAEALAASDMRLATLDALADEIPAATLETVIHWVGTGAAVLDLASQIRNATTRVHDLVDSVKGFTFMDREGVPQEIDIARGLAQTIAVLEGKADAKAIRVHLESADGLPPVYGFGSEINQVWQTLIDNAIDAVNADGNVTVTATARDSSIVVRVADDGPGVPQQNRSRIFDPFFTTKPVGKGAGLGLYQARRIVHEHRGDIDVTSKPGRTVFRVHLPLTGTRTVQPGPAGT